jgi:SSS family solute:Na+ symporter
VSFLPAALDRACCVAGTRHGSERFKAASEAAYIAMGMRVLPPGMVGVLLAAMLASSMASLSAHNHIITGIFAKDLYQGYLRRDASDRHMLKASRITSFGVGIVMIGVALLFAQGASGIFTLLFILESMFLIPLGLPLLYGFSLSVGRGGRLFALT